MHLVSWNVNGLRAVHKKGFLDWFEIQKADIVCLQEIKVKPDQLAETPELLNPLRYHAFWHPAQKPGYSGLVVYTKKQPLSVSEGIGIESIDSEGRVLELEFKDFTLLNTYFPNSQRDHARLDYKLEFCDKILRHMEKLRAQGKNIVICGDFNIAHQEIDLKNPKSNMKNAGFLPDERAWMDKFIAHKYTDAFRHFEKGPGHYTWWSYRPGVREKNIGWRLDYFFVNSDFQDRLKTVQHLPDVMGSDHCPVMLNLKK
jgi:exodeoxyribonuclease-3